jgi:Protein of unknown function (DUF2934)
VKSRKVKANERSTATVIPAKGATEGISRPTSDEIRMRAFQIYLDRGTAQGSDLDDWLQAERELR